MTASPAPPARAARSAVATEAALTAVSAAYRDELAAEGEISEFPLDPYDRTGIPVVATVWDDGRRDAHGVGYGPTYDAATVGALGEVAERVLAARGLRRLPVTEGSYRELVTSRGVDGVADPLALVIDAGADYSPDRPLSWVPAVRWRTGEPVLVPAEFAAFDAGSLPAPADGLVTPITNGMGAGDTVQRAVGHGLLELLQRDGDNVVFRALDRGVVVDLSTSTHRPTLDALATLRAAGIEPIVKLASTEFACVVYAVGDDTHPDASPIALGAIGEAAHPDRDTAVVKALLEFASSRARRTFAFGPVEDVARLSPDYWKRERDRPLGPQEPRALAAMRDWTTYDMDAMRAALQPLFRRERTVPLADLPTSDVEDPAGLLDLLLDRLAAFDVLVVPVPTPDENMVALKVLAPGLEVETLSYLRLGERAYRALLEQDGGLVGPGAPDRPGRLAVPLTADATERLGGPVWVDADAVAAVVGPLYPLYREPRRHAAGRVD